MSKRLISIIAIALLTCGVLFAAQSFTTLDVRKYHGKNGIKPLTTALDVNFVQIASTSNPTFGALTVTATTTLSGVTLIIANLPTATTGLTTDMIWSNNNILTVIP